MSRPKGSKNNNFKTGAKFTNEQKEMIKEIVSKQGEEHLIIMPKYDVVTALNSDAISEYVNDMIDRGYICQGGVSVTTYSDMGERHFLYCQAMVRREG
jgi:hypothetical protein